MDHETAKRIVDLQEKIQSDTLLMDEYRELHARFIQMQAEINENQRNILMDYLGICIEIHLKMLEEAIK